MQINKWRRKRVCKAEYMLSLSMPFFFTWHKIKLEQAQRGAAGDLSGRIYTEKYVSMSKKFDFWPIKTLFNHFKPPKS